MSGWNALRWADLILTSASCVGSLVLLWVYAWGNDWHASRVGRALVFMACAIAVLTGVGAGHRAMGYGEADWFTTIALGVVVALVIELDVAFFQERRYVRRQQTKQRMKRESGEP